MSAQEREALVELLESSQHAPMIDHDSRTGECLMCPIPLHACSPDEIADALLAAGWSRPIPGGGEAEAKAELESLIQQHGPARFSPAAACRCGEPRVWDTWTTYTRHLAAVIVVRPAP